MLDRRVQYLQIIALLTLLWVVLHERVDFGTIILGAAVGTVAVTVTNSMVLKSSYRKTYYFRIGRAAVFFLRLLVEIYKAGFEAIWRMFTGRIGVGVVEVTTNLRTDFAISLLANAITLTPGTVTLTRNGQALKVIWLSAHDLAGAPPPDQSAIEEQIKGRLERMLKEVVLG